MASNYVLTTDWDNIQERHIDPHSPVASENHNKLLAAFGTSKMWVNGLEISFIVDSTNTLIIGELTKGTVFVDYMVIIFKENPVFEITGLTGASTTYVVVDYTFRTYSPAPVATIKVIPVDEYDADHQLILYELHYGDWSTYGSFPSQSEVDAWFSDPSNMGDNRIDEDNLPTWAKSSFITLENSTTEKLTITGEPTDPTDAVTKEYVDTITSTPTEGYNNYFVRKYSDDEDTTTYGKVREDVDVYKVDPIIAVHDADDDGKGLSITADGTSVTFDNTKKKYTFKVGGNAVVEINSDGVTGALWNADIAEYFDIDPEDPNLQIRPEHGTCICVKNGKAHISDSEGDPSCIGFVSYTAAYVLGGSTMFDKEFKENHKIPVARLGQLKYVCVYTNGREMIDSGALLVSGLDGRALAVSPYNNPYPECCVVGKALVPVYPGENDNVHILVK